MWEEEEGKERTLRASHKIFEKETEGLLIAIRVVNTDLPNDKRAEGGDLSPAISWCLSLVSSWCENVARC